MMDGDLENEAGEYVLGTLDGAERAAFATRLQHDDAARGAVARWDQRLIALAGIIRPLAPPPHVWLALQRLIERESPSDATMFDDMSAFGVGIANLSLARSMRRWRAIAVVSMAAAACLIVYVTSQSLSGGPDVSYVAAINRGGDQPALIVRVDLRTHTVQVRPVAAETPQGKSLELWYIGAGEKPRSMGLVDNNPLTMPIPAGVHAQNASFAVTVEPPGGSKQAGPTGPVVYSGTLIKE